MEKVLDAVSGDKLEAVEDDVPTLDAVAPEGARRMLPILYLRGLSTGDFREAPPVLLGEDAAGLSATNIGRLTASWDEDYQAFRRRTCRRATTSTCGWTGSTSTSGWKTTGCARW